MSRKRDAAALVRRVFGSDDESSEDEARGFGEASSPSRTEGGTPCISGHLPPPRPCGSSRPTASGTSAPGGFHPRPAPRARRVHARGAGVAPGRDTTRGARGDPAHLLPAISVASRVAREAPSRAYEARRRANRPFISVTKVKNRVDDSTSTTPPHLARKNQAMRFGNFPRWAATLADSVARLAKEDGALPFPKTASSTGSTSTS